MQVKNMFNAPATIYENKFDLEILSWISKNDYLLINGYLDVSSKRACFWWNLESLTKPVCLRNILSDENKICGKYNHENQKK